MAERAHPGRQHPAHVPDEPGADIGAGFDTDGDGRPDTVLGVDGVDLVVAIDLDGDGFADEVLRIGPDAVVRAVGPQARDVHACPDTSPDGAGAGGEPERGSGEDQ